MSAPTLGARALEEGIDGDEAARLVDRRTVKPQHCQMDESYSQEICRYSLWSRESRASHEPHTPLSHMRIRDLGCTYTHLVALVCLLHASCARGRAPTET